MNRWRKSPQTILVGIAMMFSLVLLSSISGCVKDSSSPLSSVLDFVGHGPGLPEDAQREYVRFEQVFKQYVADEDDEYLDYFGFAYKRLRASYVKVVPDAALIDAAIQGVEEAKLVRGATRSVVVVETALDAITASLDPHTSYMNGDEFRESFVQTKGEFGGLGIEVTMEDGFVKVVSPIEGTPASRSDLKSGDLITHVDQEAIQGKTLPEAVRKMRGRPGTDIELKVRRKGVADFDVLLTRAIIQVRAVRWHMEGDIGYIRVSRFSERMEGGIVKAFAALRAEYGREPAGIVLDLRNNPGGLLDQSVILSDSFLNAGEIVTVRGRTTRSSSAFTAEQGDLANGLPMVVLINGGSASASEIVASALKFHKRATIMGTQSFGKGSVQTIIPLPVEGALRLTTALYYGPNGETLQARGVAPDVFLEPIKSDEEDSAKGTKEADLPGALPAAAHGAEFGQSRVPVSQCKEIGERKDRELGCALAFLHAGSTSKFLADHGGQKSM